MSADGLARVLTARMTAERLRAEHAAELAILLRDPRVARMLSAQGPPSEARVREILANNVDRWERDGFGLWLLRESSTGSLIGRGGLQRTNVAGADEVEVAWAIVPERWGEGLATELANASLGVAFGALGLEDVVAFALPANVASRRVMEKVGFAYEREFDHVSLPHVLYRVQPRRTRC